MAKGEDTKNLLKFQISAQIISFLISLAELYYLACPHFKGDDKIMHLKSANPEVRSHHLVRSLTAPQGQPVSYLIHREPPMVTESTDVVTAGLGQG